MNLASIKDLFSRPIVGVFVANVFIRKLNTRIDSFKTSLHYRRFIELVEANKEAKITLYFFCKRDVDLERLTIKGTFYNEISGRWERKEFPFPHILYDRAGRSKESNIIRKKISSLSIPSLNAKEHFDKWDHYQQLAKCPQVKPFLPETVMYNSRSDLQKLFAKNRTLYLKATKVNFGRGVIRVSKLTEGCYEYSYMRKGKIISKQVQDINILEKRLKCFFKNKRFIIQQGIDLPMVQGSIFDLRGEVQRNGEGKLEISAILVKVAEKGSPVTASIASTACTFEELYAQRLFYPKDKLEQLKSKIEDFLFKVYHCTEEAYGRFGEIAIDFAIDTQGKIWFIECNAKSAKTTASKTYNQSIIRKTFLNPLEYAKYLYKNGIK